MNPAKMKKGKKNVHVIIACNFHFKIGNVYKKKEKFPWSQKKKKLL